MKSSHLFFITFILCISVSKQVIPQNFAPLNLGNVWVWADEWGIRRKSIVVDTNYYFNNSYYSRIIYNASFGGYLYSYFNEHDNLYYQYQTIAPYNNGNLPFYKLNCVVGDTFSYPWFNAKFSKEVLEEYQTMVFDTILTVKVIFYSHGGLVEGNEVWTDEFGMLFQDQSEVYSVTFQLRGCIINGIVYGDTSTTVGIDDDTPLIHQFKLHQNYPNPFNPSTKIEYELNEYSLVTLKVYDLLGNEISILVNEEKYPGKYSASFSGNNLGSGPYFYKLTIGGSSQTRKMILLR